MEHCTEQSIVTCKQVFTVSMFATVTVLILLKPFNGPLFIKLLTICVNTVPHLYSSD